MSSNQEDRAERFQVLVDEPLTPEMMALLEGESDIHVWPEDTAAQDALLGSIEGFLTYGHPHVDGAMMDRMPHLRIISNFGVGVDHIDLDAAKERGIPVGNTPNVVDGATADLTLTLLLAAARNLIPAVQHAHSDAFAHYEPALFMGQEVHGATLGIVGMGNIGRQVAQRAHGFDMKILYHNRRRDEQAEAALGATYVSLPDLLRQSDFVTLNVPLTPETRGMIGWEQLALMKPTAILINVARGGVVDNAALQEALEQHQIAGAALDVTEPEPLPRDHPLLKLDNLLIAPHLGSATHKTRRKMAELSIANLLAGLRGDDLIHRKA